MAITIDQKAIARTKKKLIAQIQAIVKPNLHGSGFSNNETGKSLQLIAFDRNKEGEITKTIRGAISHVLQEGFDGYTEYGLITDGYAGGLGTCDYQDLCIEDLFKLRNFTAKYFEKRQKAA